MGSTQDFADYVIDQARGPWTLRAKKMFGEFMVYVNDKPILLICDNQVFVKIRPELDELLVDAETGHPYAGAKLHYLLDVENRDLTTQVIEILEPITDLPKPRSRKR